MTPEQFDALVRMIDAMIDSDSREARANVEIGLIKLERKNRWVDNASKLLVDAPASEVCSHLWMQEIGVDYEICHKCGVERAIASQIVKPML